MSIEMVAISQSRENWVKGCTLTIGLTLLSGSLTVSEPAISRRTVFFHHMQATERCPYMFEYVHMHKLTYMQFKCRHLTVSYAAHLQLLISTVQG